MIRGRKLSPEDVALTHSSVWRKGEGRERGENKGIEGRVWKRKKGEGGYERNEGDTKRRIKERGI